MLQVPRFIVSMLAKFSTFIKINTTNLKIKVGESA